MVSVDVQLSSLLELLKKEHSEKTKVFDSLIERKWFIRADEMHLLVELLSEHGLREELIKIGVSSKDSSDETLKRMHDWAQSKQHRHESSVLHPLLVEARSEYLLKVLALTTAG